MTKLLCLFLLGCTATIDGQGRDVPPDAGTDAAPGAMASDAAADGAVTIDGSAQSAADDLSRCASNALIKTTRSQLMSYSVVLTDANATLENFPVTQYRPAIGVPGFGVGFGTEVLAVRVRVPLSYVPTDATHLGFVRIAEAPGQPVTSHALCVSANACDFSGCANAGDTAPGVSFTVSGPPAAGVKNVVPGQVFWINVAHLTDNGDPSCPTETCGILLDFASPNRY